MASISAFLTSARYASSGSSRIGSAAAAALGVEAVAADPVRRRAPGRRRLLPGRRAAGAGGHRHGRDLELDPLQRLFEVGVPGLLNDSSQRLQRAGEAKIVLVEGAEHPRQRALVEKRRDFDVEEHAVAFNPETADACTFTHQHVRGHERLQSIAGQVRAVLHRFFEHPFHDADLIPQLPLFDAGCD